MSEYSIYVSALSLVVSVAVLYLTQLQRPVVTLHVGSTLGFCHLRNGFGLYAPLTFLNSAHRTGVVKKCAALITFPESPSKSHYIEWAEFKDYDSENRKWVRENFAGPLPVSGRSSESRMALFEWCNGEVMLPKGIYQITFYVWLTGSAKPEIASYHTGELPEDKATDLANFKAESKQTIRYFSIDQEIERNKILTQHEIKALLG